MTINGWQVTQSFDPVMNSLRLKLSKGGDTFVAVVDNDANRRLDNWTRDREKKWSPIIAIATARRQQGEAEINVSDADVRSVLEIEKLNQGESDGEGEV